VVNVYLAHFPFLITQIGLLQDEALELGVSPIV